MKEILLQSLEKSMSYLEFKTLVSDLVKDGKSTGKNQSEILLNYTILTERRMKRLDKTIMLNDSVINTIAKVDKNIGFIVLMESWCGDGAQTLPVINKIAILNDKIDFKIILRDENEALMNRFLTNGGKSIPKLIVYNKDNFEVLSSWGPRPKEATKMVDDYKREHGKLDAEFKKNLQVWYNKDKGVATQNDFVAILNTIA